MADLGGVGPRDDDLDSKTYHCQNDYHHYTAKTLS